MRSEHKRDCVVCGVACEDLAAACWMLACVCRTRDSVVPVSFVYRNSVCARVCMEYAMCRVGPRPECREADPRLLRRVTVYAYIRCAVCVRHGLRWHRV